MGDEGHVRVEERGDAVARVTLARPAKRNALTAEMLDRLGALFESFSARTDLRAVILSGEGADFCAGTDINALASLDPGEASATAERGQRVCDLMELCRVPVIAALWGAAAGGGCELALACHLRVAARGARFTLPELRLGVIPAYGGTQRLARAAGQGRALALMLAGDGLTAAEAHARGLVNRLADDPAGALAEAEALARQIAGHAAPLAVRACLEAVTEGTRLPLQDGLALEARLFARLFDTEDVREGTRAFLEKRPPLFKGR